jgi:Arc/MetJ family transcription regulator
MQVLNVYDWCMARTNIDIDEQVVGDVMRRYRLATKTEAVDLALRRLADRPMTRDEALAMRGARSLDEVPEDTPSP